MNSSSTGTHLSDSVSDLSASARLIGTTHSKRGSSAISKVTKQATTLFVTRRLPEALQTLDPIIVPQEDEDQNKLPALIATASQKERVKTWNLYITLLNAIVELDPEDGKSQFGHKEWRAIVTKVRDGAVWEDVVQRGYYGVEGAVDADVVSNLVTLLLEHSQEQKVTQMRLENYLSASSHPNLDISDRFDTLSHHNGDAPIKRPHNNGTDTPRDLAARIKVLELFTLHVLPRNEEYEYAIEFISSSPDLDEDVRDEFLQTLESLKEQKAMDEDAEAAIKRQQEEDLERERKEAEQRRIAAGQIEEAQARARSADSKRSIGHTRTESEHDYGIEPPAPKRVTAPLPKPSKSALSNKNLATPRGNTAKRAAQTKGVYKRGVALVTNLQHLIASMANSMAKSPMALMRMILFLTALIVAFSRRDVRERVGRLTGIGWDKIKGTVGMGVKVSYI